MNNFSIQINNVIIGIAGKNKPKIGTKIDNK